MHDNEGRLVEPSRNPHEFSFNCHFSYMALSNAVFFEGFLPISSGFPLLLF